MDSNNRIMIKYTRAYREMLIDDKYRPHYHFAIPYDDGRPGDPNGMFWANGEFHLMYLYRRDESDFCWGHMSSVDLIHWRQHKDALTACSGDNGCFSGGAFIDDDGTGWLSYWIYNEPSRIEGKNQGIGLAKGKPPYEIWERLPDAVIPSMEWGIRYEPAKDGGSIPVGCADPSNIWKRKGKYYMQTGNLLVLEKYGRKSDSQPEYQGDWTELFESTDLLNWHYCGRFYEHLRDNRWTDTTEDDMCPSYLPLPESKDGGQLSEKMLQLFISHNRGCQYYIGSERNHRFIPEQHGRMSWSDNAFFAPEACLDGKNRLIMFSWLYDNLNDDFRKYGWSGVYSLPRSLWLNRDGELGISPAVEIDSLAYNHIRISDFTLEDTCHDVQLPPFKARTCRLCFDADCKQAEQVGAEILLSERDGHGIKLYYDSITKELVFDPCECIHEGKNIVERAPLILNDGELLRLSILIDNSVVEVFANDRQAISRKAFIPDEIRSYARVYAKGTASFSSIQVSAMASTNLY